MSYLEVLITAVYWIGFWVTLWAGATNRFRLKPYGLPMSRSAVFLHSVLNALSTLGWFIFVPGWFVYRWVTRTRRMHT